MISTLNLPPKLVEYLHEARAPQPAVTDPDQPLQLDSLGLIRLIAFLENDLQIKVEDDELLIDNFATLRRLAEFLDSKPQQAWAEVGQKASE